MVTSSRVWWFIIAFVFALPGILVMFSGGDKTARKAWILSVLFAASIAMVMAVGLGKGSQ